MIAAWMLLLLAVEVLAWGSLALWVTTAAQWPDWAAPLLAGAIYGGIRLALVLTSFAVARAFRGEPWPPLSARGWLACIAGEWSAVMRHHLIALPFHRALRIPRRRRRRAAVQPVLLLHGLWNNAGVWRPVRRYLGRRGHRNVYSVTYGPPWSSIESFADRIAAEVERVCERTGSPTLVMVGHSMGGLVARAYLRRHGVRRVSALITLGTPHRGSEMARLAAGACGRELLPASEWIAGWESLPPIPLPCTSIYSLHDNLVAPQWSPELPGAKWIAVPGVGHNAMHYSRRFQELLDRELVALRALTSGSPA